MVQFPITITKATWLGGYVGYPEKPVAFGKVTDSARLPSKNPTLQRYGFGMGYPGYHPVNMRRSTPLLSEQMWKKKIKQH